MLNSFKIISLPINPFMDLYRMYVKFIIQNLWSIYEKIDCNTGSNAM